MDDYEDGVKNIEIVVAFGLERGRGPSTALRIFFLGGIEVRG
jgi:hypothetical protein